MKILTSMLVLGGLVLGATPLLAATYQYVDVNGDVQVEVANSATEAIQTAPNIHPHSGVIEVGEGEAVLTAGADRNTEVYGYINIYGGFATQVAETPSEAIALAPNIKSNSGVMLIIE